MVKSICFSHIGMRPNHEDNIFLNGKIMDSATQQRMPEIKLIQYQSTSITDTCVFAVSDGMGGHNAGEIASSMCVQEFARVNSQIQCCNSISELVTLIQKSINKANVDICTKSQRYSETRGMGATLVVLAVCGTNCAVLNVGDSRAYVCSGGILTQITKDNTEGQRSDGVTDSLTELEIKEILCSENDISCAGKKIIEQSVIPNNADNATAMLIKIGR